MQLFFFCSHNRLLSRGLSSEYWSGAQALSVLWLCRLSHVVPTCTKEVTSVSANQRGASREGFAAQVWKWRILALLISVCPELSCMTVLSPEEAEKHSLNAQVKAAAAMMSS